MSANKHFRNAWVRVTFREAVRLFHEVRRAEENADADLSELARQCANEAFQMRADSILRGAEEVTAREFMAYCRENFAAEIYKAVAETKEAEPELVC